MFTKIFGVNFKTMMIMKKIYSILLVIIAAMVTLYSCQKNEIILQNEGIKVDFFAEQIETKTAFGDRTLVGGNYVYPTLWTVNDSQVKVALNTEQATATIITADPYTTARFEATFTGGTAPYTFYALSPASAVQTLTNYNWLLNFPSSQTPLTGSVDEAAQILFAKSAEFPDIPASVVPLTFSHLTAYGKLTLTNLTLAADETISAVNLISQEGVVGRWDYDPTKDPSVEPQLTANAATNTIILSTTSASNLWFACAPIDMSGKTLDVAVCTNKGTHTRQITFPANKKFEAGKVSVFSVNMSTATYEDFTAYFEVPDAAFADYLVYNTIRTDEYSIPSNVVLQYNGKIYIHKANAANVTNLYLVKDGPRITALTAAGVPTAAQKIANLAGIQFFTNVTEIKLTSNELVGTLDFSMLTKLETLEMNYNFVNELIVPASVTWLRYQASGSSSAPDNRWLTAIDVSANSDLVHLHLPRHKITTAGLVLPTNYSKLTYIDLSNNTGAPFAIPAALFNQLLTAKGVVSE